MKGDDMLKDDLINFVKTQTEYFKFEDPSEKLTAEYMCGVFGTKRNTVSHYLNRALEEGLLIKINTRPVYFLHREMFERQFFGAGQKVYRSWKDLQREGAPSPDSEKKERFQEEEDDGCFRQMIGYGGSLRYAISQVKTSIFYPDNSLPIMLNGPTGSGKSFMAERICQFAKEKGILEPTAPFISLNCAQYANNPELLSSNLFGYVKGAFTGAVKDSVGLLEAADHGILFLDEVHRLNYEGQEKLFTFLDRGIYSRMGENDVVHSADVRIIMATTEDLSSGFLDTFLRRIPICISMPSLEERGPKEKYEYIYRAFLKECNFLKKNICVSSRAMELLMNYQYSGNIGELQSTIKYMAAAQYSENRNQEEIRIGLHSLPDKILRAGSHEITGKADVHYKNIVITPESDPSDKIMPIYESEKYIDRLVRCLENSLEWEMKRDDYIARASREITETFDQLLQLDINRKDQAVYQFVWDRCTQIFQEFRNNYKISFNSSDTAAVSNYLFHRKFQMICADDVLLEKFEKIRRKITPYCTPAFQMAERLLQTAGRQIEMEYNSVDKVILALFLKSSGIDTGEKKIRGVVLARGTGVAGGMAAAANRLLEARAFEAVSIPINCTEQEISEALMLYMEEHNVSGGLLAFVDMGSPEVICEPLQEILQGPLAVVDGVSVRMLVFAGENMKYRNTDRRLGDLLQKIQRENTVCYKLIYPEKKRQKTIITCCETGIGTADKLREILEASIPEEYQIRIVSDDYYHLKKSGENSTLFRLNEVIGIIGSKNPGIGEIPFVSIDELMSGNSQERLEEILSFTRDEKAMRIINDRLIRNFSMERLINMLTILDSGKVIENIETILRKYEIKQERRLSNQKKMSLIFHLSCLIERLIRQTPIETYPDLEKFVSAHDREIAEVYDDFRELESIYSIKIPVSELAYIHNILYSEW